MSNIDRRAFFRRLGLGVVAVGPVGGLARLVGASPRDGEPDVLDSILEMTEPGVDAASARALLEPLTAGSRLATSMVADIETHGRHLAVVLRTDAGMPYRIEIFRRDDTPTAPRPVTRTSRYDLFVANGGHGDKRTAREHGLAAYALAEVLSRNEAMAPVRLGTLGSRA